MLLIKRKKETEEKNVYPSINSSDLGVLKKLAGFT
jgi:hypothetical protein